MRVRNLTLTTASAAALTIGLTSPALAAAFQSDETAGLHHRAQHVAVYPAAHQALSAHAPGLARGGDDGDGDGDGDDDGLDPCVAGGCFGGGNNNGGGIAPWAAFGDDDGCGDDGGCGGGGNGAAGGSVIGGAPGGGYGHSRETVKKVHGRVMGMPGRPAGVGMVPSGPVRTGFGGAQGSSVPAGLAGLTLMLGGTTLLARRRIRTGARS